MVEAALVAAITCNRWQKSRSVGKWMCNCSDTALGPARQFV